MLGCSAFGLRSWGSVVLGAKGKRWFASAGAVSARPVSDEEFRIAFEHVYPRERWGVQRHVGLAVSGGVDSMALAQLYSRLSQENPKVPRAHGIIIDHKARPDSTEEAEWVAEQLKSKLHIPATIVPLVWPEYVDLQDLTSFETDARRLRYQALGLACKEHDLNALLVAHHGDDQAETIMMRLMKDRFRSGLQGIQSVEWIPECHGMHGIHHSGGGRIHGAKGAKPWPFACEDGGIQILRPLLNFEKDRLITTCKENDMPWAEDATNKDATLTTRNAVRHVLANHKLPAALSKPALISLAQHMQGRVQEHRQKAEALFTATRIQLHIQLGAATVDFPPADAFLDRPILTESDKKYARNTAHLYLHRITELVTPKDQPSVGELANAVDNIWPALQIDIPNATVPPTTPEFCVFGILFRPINVSLTKKNKAKPPGQSPSRPVFEKRYLLVRQPPSHHERSQSTMSMRISPGAAPEWKLFDNRFWLHVSNHSPCDLHVRTLTMVDLQDIAAKYPRIRDKLLANLKPVDLRLGVPAIFKLVGGTGNGDEKEELVALPTLGASLDKAREVCEWRVMYKKVDFGSKNPGDVVIWGTAGLEGQAVVQRGKHAGSRGNVTERGAKKRGNAKRGQEFQT